MRAGSYLNSDPGGTAIEPLLPSEPESPPAEAPKTDYLTRLGPVDLADTVLFDDTDQVVEQMVSEQPPVTTTPLPNETFALPEAYHR